MGSHATALHDPHGDLIEPSGDFGVASEFGQAAANEHEYVLDDVLEVGLGPE
jgi:hypothetical protein